LRTCPGVAVLATSREALGVGGEVTWQVPPLALPAKDVPCPVESLGSYDAVRLFVDRAVKARPNFAVTNATAPVVAEICARLDGFPLAILLAAARIRVLAPQQMLEGLEDRFRLLTGGGRGRVRRQPDPVGSVVGGVARHQPDGDPPSRRRAGQLPGRTRLGTGRGRSRPGA